MLRKGYNLQANDIPTAIRALLATTNVRVHTPALEAGLSMLEANGDVAGGVIACGETWLSGETFVSFDKRAFALLTAQGQPARLLCRRRPFRDANNRSN